MTVSSQTSRIDYAGDGVTAIFPVPFYFLENTHLQVILSDDVTGAETVLVLNTDYTVTGAGVLAGGSITVPSEPAVGFTLTILRSVPKTQETDYVPNDPFPAESHERALDKLTMIAQQQSTDIAGAIKVAVSDPEPSRLPPAASRALRLMGFDASGDPIAVVPTSDSAAGLALDLLNASDPSKGAALVGYNPALTYPPDTVGEVLNTGEIGWARSALASAISTVAGMLNAQTVSIWEYADLVTVKPTPGDPGTWDWSPAVAQAFADLAPVGTLEFTEGTFKFSGVSTSSTISLLGQGSGATILQNFTAGATMLTYDQIGMADKERRNWLTFEGVTVLDEASFTGSGIVTNGVLSIIIRDSYIREFKTGFGLQVLEALWVYLNNVHSDLSELNFKSTAVPHNNNVIAIRGCEIRNPPAGKFGLYVENGDIIHLSDSTIEGIGGGAMTAGGKFKSVKMLNLENTYFEVLSTATEAGLSLDGCQAVRINGGQLNSQSTTIPSLLVNECDAVKIGGSVMVAFPIRTTGINSVTMEGCLAEGPMDISAATSFKVVSPMPYNTRATWVTQPSMQTRPLGKPKAFRNSYADSSFESAAPGTSIIAGAPVSSLDTAQGYFGPNSWRVTGVAGDTIRTASLGVTTSNGQSGCMSFMAKADTAGRFTLLMFLAGSAGGHDIYLSTEWRRYFLITNLRPASTTGSQFLLQLAFQDTNAFNITDIQFVPFTDYGEIPGIVDGFNYIPTHGAAITGAISKEVAADKRYFDRGLNLRKTTIAPVAPEDGDIYYADGTGWNPGAGAGIYWYNGTVFTKM